MSQPLVSKAPRLSVVVPVHNEEQNLLQLWDRLVAVLEDIDTSWEVVFTDDGSQDGSLALLLDLRKAEPERVQVIEFVRNFGQHMAVLAGLQRARGATVVTIDADLQNPPEEIPRLLALVEAGHDVVSGYRESRQDSRLRKLASNLAGFVSEHMTGLAMRDQGCMLRAYRRDIVELIVRSNETITFIPALAALYARNPVDVAVGHAARAAGESNYDLYRLIRLNFDLVTGFSAAPLQLFALAGLIVSASSGLLVLLMVARRIFVGPEVEGVFTLFGIVFFLMGVCITGLGIIGEYVARVYQEVRRRPAFVIRKVHDGSSG